MAHMQKEKTTPLTGGLMQHDFLAAVLPSTGRYCVCEVARKREHFFVETLTEVENTTRLLDVAEREPFFALATFGPDNTRTGANALWMRALFMDIDCGPGKGYATQRDAVEHLQEFLEFTGLIKLGQPWIVSSGGGIHVYLPFNRDLPISEWKPLAEALKMEAYNFELKIDGTVTADAARVLRLPGTHNRKIKGNPRPVELKLVGGVFDVEQVKALLAPVTKTLPASALALKTPAGIAGVRPKPIGSALTLLANSTTSFRDIMQRTADGSGCLQLKHYVDNAEDDGMEPLWRGLLSIAKCCSDGVKAAKKLSELHPYDQDRLERKWAEIKGPYPCSKFNTESLGICTKCPHFGKITNPLALGRSVTTETAAKVVEVKLEDEAAGLEPVVMKYARPVPPRGFSYGEKGGVFCEREEKDGNGQSYTQQVMILAYELFVVDILRIDNVHTVHLAALRPEGVKDITIPMKAVISKDDTTKALAEQNIVAAFGAGNDVNLHQYIRAAVEQASMRKAATRVPAQLGWQPDKTFAYGGKLYHPNGTEQTVPMLGMDNITQTTKAVGTLDGWRRIVQLLIDKQMYGHLAIMMVGAGSPLMEFTGLHGLTFHAGHKISGTGKSLALSVGASIWGHPIHYRVGKTTSPVAMQQRLGLLNSLPFMCDELTAVGRNNLEWMPNWAFDQTEGKGKERMEAGANKERINTSTWSNLAVFTSNIFLPEMMLTQRQHSSEGELRRILDWSPKEVLSWTEEELDILRTLDNNYGVAGPIYAKWLAQNRQKAELLTKQTMSRLYKTYKATNDERYWLAGVSATVAGSVAFGSSEAGIIDLPVQRIIEEFGRMIVRMRGFLANSKGSAADVLDDYIKQNMGSLLIIKPQPQVAVGLALSGKPPQQQSIKGELAGRVEYECQPGWTDTYIDVRTMKLHCSQAGHSYNEFVDEIKQLYDVTTTRKDLTEGTGVTPLRVMSLRIRRRSTDQVFNGIDEAEDE